MSRIKGSHSAESTKQKLRERFQHHPADFWARCDQMENGCFVRIGRGDKFGYVLVGYQGKQWLAHRLAWTLAKGPIPDGICVLHKCDNPPCCNPDHLFLGTNQDNSDDCIKKGRYHRHIGDTHPRAKLSCLAVQSIKKLYQPYVTTRKMLADRFGVSTSTIHAALCGQNWNHDNSSRSYASQERKRSPVSEDMVRRIWALRGSGHTYKQIGQIEGVAPTTACAIITGQNWRKIYEEMHAAS